MAGLAYKDLEFWQPAFKTPLDYAIGRLSLRPRSATLDATCRCRQLRMYPLAESHRDVDMSTTDVRAYIAWRQEEARPEAFTWSATQPLAVSSHDLPERKDHWGEHLQIMLDNA